MALIRQEVSRPMSLMLHVWAEKPGIHVKFMRTQSDNEERQMETSVYLSTYKTLPWRKRNFLIQRCF